MWSGQCVGRLLIGMALCVCATTIAAAQTKPEKGATSPPPLTAAERIAGVRKLLDADRVRRAELVAELDRLEDSFRETSDTFTRLDADLKAARVKAEASGADADAEALKKIEAEWTPVRDRFERIIERRKAAQQQIEILDEKIDLEQKVLERLESADAEVARNAVSKAATKDGKPRGKSAPATSDEPDRDPSETPVHDRELAAQRELDSRLAELAALEEELGLLDRSIDVFERDLEVARQLLASAREDDAAAEDIEKQSRLVTESEALLERMRLGREQLQEKIAAATSAVEKARTHLWYLQSPLAPHRLWHWLASSGPRVLTVIFFVILARWVSRFVGRKVVSLIVGRRTAGHEAERDARAETLRRVFQNATGTAILVLGTLAVLDQVGVNVTVLLGGAAVIGAAIAFGSQNLIRDFFAGFMILVENQYSVGHVIRIGSISGAVEDISLRTTVLRDEEGVVHFIPHGQITTVSNLSYGWSRVAISIGIAYQEDVDRVMQVLMDVARQLAQDETFGRDVIDEPQMLGVDALGDSSVAIKFLLKTRPLRQWAVKRELLRRIKLRFDELGIEIPFPQRVIHMQAAEQPAEYDRLER